MQNKDGTCQGDEGRDCQGGRKKAGERRDGRLKRQRNRTRGTVEDKRSDKGTRKREAREGKGI